MVLNRQTLTQSSHKLSNYKNMKMDEICAVLQTLAPLNKKLRPCGSRIRSPNRITRQEINAIAQKIVDYDKHTLQELRNVLRGFTIGRERHTPSPRNVVKHYTPKGGVIFEYYFDDTKDTLQCDKRIGKGGFGVVYRCKSKYFGTVALKTYHGKSDKLLRNLNHELYMLNKVAPYNIYVGGFTDNTFYLITEYISGENCVDKKLTNKALIKLYTDISSILKKAHSKGIAHKDIKPDNIIYDEDTRDFVLVDWGLACFIDYKSKLTEYTCDRHPKAGTRDFLSPWLTGKLRGKKCTKGQEYIRNDWWALGITLYELAHGKVPEFNSAGRKTLDLKTTKNEELDSIIAGLLDVKRPCL